MFFSRKIMSTLKVAAIDLGTTFSGYAYFSEHEYNRDPLEISTNAWDADTGGLASFKTSTCVLFDPTGTFHSFGYEAEENYSALKGKNHDWYYFRKFKMMVYDKMVCISSFLRLYYIRWTPLVICIRQIWYIHKCLDTALATLLSGQYYWGIVTYT